MSAADQVVPLPAAGGPPVFRGHRQPLVDAERGRPLGTVPAADGEDGGGDQAAHHRPRDGGIRVRPGGRGPVRVRL